MFLAICRSEAAIATSLGTWAPLQALNQAPSLLCTCSLLPSGGLGWRLAKGHLGTLQMLYFPEKKGFLGNGNPFT